MAAPQYLIIKGRIADVAWVETYGATKIQVKENGKTYSAYQLSKDVQYYDEAVERLQEEREYGAQVWYDVAQGYDKDFVLENIVLLGKHAKESRKPELRAIYVAIRDGDAATYQQYRSRLQEMVTLLNQGRL